MELLLYLVLSQFPSGSSINYKDGKLFLVGDDAKQILILTSTYQEAGTASLFEHTKKRIPKKEKPDFEAATFLNINGVEHFFMLGSASNKRREILQMIPYQDENLNITESKTISTTDFIQRVQQQGVEEINFEGLTVFKNKLIISNRGNLKYNTNHLILTDADFWQHQNHAAIKLVPLQIPPLQDSIVGVSELHYEKSLDMLLLTFSSEATGNAYDDGAIGNSYLGWIEHFSEKEKMNTLALDKIICLPEVHTEFVKQKIEGLCIEQIKNDTIILHLISDNDTGESKLFRLEVPFTK